MPSRQRDRNEKPFSTQRRPSKPWRSYDQGGAIELETGRAADKTTGALTSPAIARAMQALDAGPITLEAGVALFQAFELGAGPSDAQIDAPPAIDVRPAAAPTDGNSEAKADEGGDTLHQAAGVGLGLLAALPIVRRRKRNDEGRWTLRPRSSNA